MTAWILCTTFNLSWAQSCRQLTGMDISPLSYTMTIADSWTATNAVYSFKLVDQTPYWVNYAFGNNYPDQYSIANPTG